MSINKPSSPNSRKSQTGKPQKTSPVTKTSDRVSDKVHKIMNKK